MATLLIKNIGTLQTPIGSFAHKGRQQGENRKLHQAAILAEDGIIKAITADGTLPCSEDEADTVIDAEDARTGGRTYAHGVRRLSTK